MAIAIRKAKTAAKRVKPTNGEVFPSLADVERTMQKEGTITLAITFDKKRQLFEACSLGGHFKAPLIVDPGQNPVGAIAKPRISFKGKEWHGRLYPSGQAVFQRSATPAK